METSIEKSEEKLVSMCCPCAGQFLTLNHSRFALLASILCYSESRVLFLKTKMFIFILCVCFTCVFLHAACMFGPCGGLKRVLKLKLQAVVKPPYGCWELNQGPLIKQQLALTDRPFSPLQVLDSLLRINFHRRKHKVQGNWWERDVELGNLRQIQLSHKVKWKSYFIGLI